MKLNLSKKQKIAASASAAIAAASSLVAPLAMTGCTNSKALQNSAIDQEYGVTKETYEDLKEQFRIEYSNKLKKVYAETSKDFKLRMEALEEDLKTFDKVDSLGSFSYTALTNSLIDFAREHKQKYPTATKSANGVATQETEAYGIQLVRHTRTKWSDLNDVYAGMADSIKTYMHNNKMPASTINKIMAESKAKFDDLVKQLKATYGNDALSGMINAKEKVVTYFDDVNEDIALLAASIKLKDFISEFNFSYTDYKSDGSYYEENRLDVLLKKYPDEFAEGKVLSNSLMNKIFTITRKTTDKTVDFDAKTIVPGYTIQPKLVSISQNYFSNNHSISIDFGLVKNVYAQRYDKDPEKLALVTAHNYQINPSVKEFTLNENSSLADALRLTQIKAIDYPVRLSASEEAKRLQETYFNRKSNNGSISFRWTTNKDDQAYEAFFDNARQDKNNPNKWTGTMPMQSLANAGLMVSQDSKSFTLINKVLNASKKEGHFKTQTFTDVFLQNCSLTSNVKIDETDLNHKIVKHNFKAMYSNSIYTNDKDAIVNVTDYDAICENFSISRNFYEKINDKYNAIASYVECYETSLKNTGTNGDEPVDDSKLDSLYAEALFSLIWRTTVMFVNAIALVAAIRGCISPFKDGGNYRLMAILTVILSLAVASIEAYEYYEFEHNYWRRVKKYVDNARNAKKEIHTSELVSMLKTDLNSYFVLYNDDGLYNKTEYTQKMSNFNNTTSMVQKIDMYRKYATINSYEINSPNNTNAQIAMKKFNDVLEKNDASGDEYLEITKDWKIFKGPKWLMSIGAAIIIMLLNCGITWVQYRLQSLKKFGEKVDEVAALYDEAIRRDQERNSIMSQIHIANDTVRNEMEVAVQGYKSMMESSNTNLQYMASKFLYKKFIHAIDVTYKNEIDELKGQSKFKDCDFMSSDEVLEELGFNKLNPGSSHGDILSAVADALTFFSPQ